MSKDVRTLVQTQKNLITKRNNMFTQNINAGAYTCLYTHANTTTGSFNTKFHHFDNNRVDFR